MHGHFEKFILNIFTSDNSIPPCSQVEKYVLISVDLAAVSTCLVRYWKISRWVALCKSFMSHGAGDAAVRYRDVAAASCRVWLGLWWHADVKAQADN